MMAWRYVDEDAIVSESLGGGMSRERGRIAGGHMTAMVHNLHWFCACGYLSQ